MNLREAYDIFSVELEELALEHGVKPMPSLRFNSNLVTCAGKCRWKAPQGPTGERPIVVELNPDYVAMFDEATVRLVFRHEFTHAYLYSKVGRHYHGQAFKTWCAAFGGSYYTPRSEEWRQAQTRWHYTCTGCGVTTGKTTRWALSTRRRRKCRHCGTNCSQWLEVDSQARLRTAEAAISAQPSKPQQPNQQSLF
jgi:predicted SprT family Zn-dependent metalloprotease